MPKAFVTLLAMLASGCTAHVDSVRGTSSDRLDGGADRRLANLERAAQYPWTDDGRCAVRESSGNWATLVERCYDALDRSRLRFIDHSGACPIAQAGAISADEVTRLVGICLLVQPEIAIAAVVVIGVVVVAATIATEIETARRAKKPGCYCKCLKPGEGPYVEVGRAASPEECWQKCSALKRGCTGATCT